MSEQLTIRERLEWLAGDENRQIQIEDYIYRVNQATNRPELLYRDKSKWVDIGWGSPLFDERIPVTKIEPTPEPTELEKAETELKEAEADMGAAFALCDYCAIHTYIEARLKVERLRAEAKNG